MRVSSSILPRIVRKKYSVKISMTIFAQQAKVGSEISLVLGQYGVSVSKFCTEFNERSSFLSVEIPLIVDIFLFDNREFKFIIRGVNLVKLVRRFVGSKDLILRRDIFYVSYLYFIIMKRFFLDIYFQEIFLQTVCRKVSAIIRSFNSVSPKFL